MADLKIIIDNREVELSTLDESPVKISYDLEDEKNFQSKASATALDVNAPATLANDQTFNTFRDPSIADMSPGGRYRAARPARIVADQIPVLIGKALLKNGRHTARPEGYTFNIYGDNGDWIVEMQDLTLYDCLPAAPHVFDLYGAGGPGNPPAAPFGIEDSWGFDGNNEQRTWVYAPVRYAQAFADADSNIKLNQMRPSLFLYWVIQRAFKRYGYRISSEFMDSPVFRRLVMPWTWGNFLGINAKIADLLKFRATGGFSQGATNYFSTSQSGTGTSSGSGTVYPGVLGSAFGIADSFSLNNTSSLGGYDNNGNYTFNNTNGLWTWTYKSPGGGINFGKITAYFGVSAAGEAGAASSSNATIYLDVFKNGNPYLTHTLFDAQAKGATAVIADNSNARIFNFSVTGLLPGDKVSIRFRFNYSKGFSGQTTNILYGYQTSSGTVRKTTFELFRIEIEPGGVVNWSNFEQFKKYKLLDLLRGTIDLFDLSIKTDPTTKTVFMEPTHATSVGATNFTGYFKTARLNWTGKQDLGPEAAVESFDELERDYLFRMKEDGNDGGVLVLTKRFNIEPGTGKFRFGPRVKEGKQTFENRFFSPVVHLRMTQWKALAGGAGITPQIVAIVPENISNTSAAESENDFAPKICYYKGYVTGTAGVFTMNGYTYGGYPYMFAVNHHPGGENDIVLTYNDQLINGNVAPGLLRRFFLQRLAIQDQGVKYKPWMRLNNTDVTNWLHRERIVIGSNLYLLTNIDKWDPVRPVSTQCTLWKFTPVEQKHRLQVYPSAASVLGTLSPVPAPDMAYQPTFILSSDLPTYGT